MWWSIPLTITVYFIARFIALKINHPIANPLLLAMLIIIPLLLLCQIPYSRYATGSAFINYLLQPAIVALAYPLYVLLPKIKQYWKSLCGLCLISSLLSMSIGATLAALLGASPQIIASILPKSITTAIAIAVSSSLNGIPAITSSCVIFVGILGSVLGPSILTRCKITHPAARGLTIGSISHTLGTARCMEIDIEQGAYSSLALVLCGIFSSILAPFVFQVILFFMR